MNEYLRELTNKIDDSLTQGIDPKKGVLDSAIHYALSVKGKRLRPLIFLTLLEALKKNPDDYMDIAVAIECIHTYSLIHDDLPVMDNDDYRRGMPTVHRKYNDAIALLAGDTLLTYAFEKVAVANIPAKNKVNVLRILTVAIGKDGMAGGQALDLEFTGDKKMIFEIHRMKTAELIKASVMSAAEIAGLKPEQMKTLEDAALTIGIAFQMADDLLDLVGDEREVGKKLQKDQSNQSPNCILFYGKDYVRNEIDSAFKKTVKLLKELNIDFPPFLYLVEKMVYRNR